MDYKIYGRDFIILKAKGQSSVTNIGLSILNQKFDFLEEVIATETEILLKLSSEFEISDLKRLSEVELVATGNARTLELPIQFQESDDWNRVTELTGLTEQAYKEQILKTKFTVGMFGFLPGFIYMNGLASELQVPRKKVPDKYIPKNSVAVGGKYMGIYSLPSPGGWSVIGRTPLSIMDINEMPPSLLELADQISLVNIFQPEYQDLLNSELNILTYNGLT